MRIAEIEIEYKNSKGETVTELDPTGEELINGQPMDCLERVLIR